MEAIRALDRAAALIPQFPLIYVSRGIAHEELKQFQRMLRDAQLALQIAPFNTFANGLLIRAYPELDRAGEALPTIEAWCRREPNNLEPLFYRAQAYFLIGRLDDAATDANALLARAQPFQFWDLLARIRHRQGRLDDARDAMSARSPALRVP